ncbi:MAG: Uncharacterised protein [Acidimicrobiales bacterium AG-410-I20]|nr:MAG: Uncharacterised protein [Acidimicrobiales bacterium AG-410-I20]
MLSTIWASTKGVVSEPLTPLASAAARPSLIAVLMTSGSASCSTGTGAARTTPVFIPEDQ